MFDPDHPSSGREDGSPVPAVLLRDLPAASPTVETSDRGVRDDDRRALVVVLQCAMMSALAIVLGHALSFVPNVELVTLVIFLSGYHGGRATGSLAALVTAVYFNYLNPVGQVFLPVLFGQAAGWIAAAWLGALFEARRWKGRWGLAMAGFAATLFFQLAVNGAYVLTCCPGNSVRQRLAVLCAGILFTAVHLLSNTLVFFILGPSLLERLDSLRSRL